MRIQHSTTRPRSIPATRSISATRAITRARAVGVLLLVLVLGAVGAGCSLVTGTDSGSPESGGEGSSRVVLVTHDSFALPEELIAGFEERTGLELVHKASGDAGALTNKLVLTKDSPIGDVAFGVDNTFASRAVSEGVFAPYDAELPPGAQQYVLQEAGDALTPIDTGNVCVNIDTTWFAEHDVAPPETLADLTEPAYEDLLVLPAATTSSPGLAFLLTTVAEFGEQWPAYWEDLMANGAKLTSGWSQAYNVDFTAGPGAGSRPIVLSYDTSPAFTLVEDGTATTTRALLQTCYRQVEYAGVLAGADNPEGAQQVIDFLLSAEVQSALPTSMYVFPVSDAAELPETWAKFAERPEDPHQLPADRVAEHRREWLTTWTDITTR